MAATLSADQEQVVYYSFPIEKREDTADINPVDGTPDIWIWGKATDGTVDGDHEIVDPEWSAKALMQWLDTGANVRMSHDPKRPAGKGHQVHVTTDGHFVKSLICDPLAKHFIRKGVLNDYSVGISNPDFRYGDRKLDPDGKALRVITGRPDGTSRVAELSVVDRGSNFNSRFSVVKSAGGFTGQMVGSDDEIAKGAPAELIKAAREEDATVTVDVPKSASITFSPTDLAKLLEHRRVAEERLGETAKYAAETAVYKRDIDTATRRRLAARGRALPNLSYPIETHEDAENAVTLALSGHGNVSAAKKLIRRIARKEGWQDILDRLDGKKDDSSKAARAGRKCKLCHGTGKIRDGEMDCPRCHGDGIRSPGEPDEHGEKAAAAEGAPGGTAAAVKADSGALHHDDGQDDDTDSDADANEKGTAAETAKADTVGAKPKVPCPGCKAMCKPKAKFCGKCGASMTAEKASKPTPGEGVTGAAEHNIQPAPEHREPDGPVVESFEHDAGLPTVPDASVKTATRLLELGVPREHGMLHDLLCPAYTAPSVKAAWPGADLTLIDEQAWQAKALETAAAAPLEEAQKASQIWTAARMLKAVTPDLYDDIMTAARKAFRDANPGPGKAPEPGEISAQQFNRPYETAGHAAPSPGHGAPHTAPIHPGHIAASDYRRDLITAGHAADSPENSSSRPEAVPAPEVPGVPSRVYYTNTQRANAQQAMRAMHDHIAMTFPDLCPMYGPGHMGEPPSHARPVAPGVGGPVPHRGKAAGAHGDEVPAFLDNGYVVPAKAAKKMAKVKKMRKKLDRDLARQIRKGVITIEQARASFGPPPQDPEGGAVKAAVPSGMDLGAAGAGLVAKVDPQILKAAVAEATAPLLNRLDAQDKRLKKQARVLDAIAGQPDPAVTAYRGAAITKTSTPAPAGPAGIAERAARAQENLIHDRIDIARNSPDPAQRVQAMYDLMEIHGLTGRTAMT